MPASDMRDTVPRKKVAGDAASLGEEMAVTNGWIRPFTEEELADFERGPGVVAEHEVVSVELGDFPLGPPPQALDDVRAALEYGRGRAPARLGALLHPATTNLLYCAKETAVVCDIC